MPHQAAAGSFGRRMRELRDVTGLSLRALADKVHSNASSLSAYERGATMPDRTTAGLIDQVLGAGGELLDLWVQRPRGRMVATSPRPLSISPESLPLCPDTNAIFTDLLGAHTSRLDLGGRTGRVSPETVSGFAQVAAHYRRSYHAVPASYLLSAALAHLGLVVSLSPADQPHPERTSLITTVGEMAALAGVILGLDAARAETALGYFDLAWRSARAAEDLDLQAVVMACRSFALAYGRHDHKAGLACADFAREIARHGGTPETQAWVAAVASERAASLGDLSGCHRRLDESRLTLNDDAGRDAVWRGIGGFNIDKLHAYEGGDMVRLKRYPDAIEILDNAVDGLDGSMHRHRATALIDRAEAHTGAGAFDAACDDALRALELVAQVQHNGNLARIEGVATHAASATAARELRHEVQLIRADHNLPIRWGGSA